MQSPTTSRWLLILSVWLAAAAPRAEVHLPTVLGDGMVLQRDQPVPVWGTAGPGEQVAVSFAGQTRTTRADPGGHWRVSLDPLKVSDTPATMTVTGSNAIKLGNVLVGEVWLCSGQSNMEMPLIDPRWGVRDNAEAIATADDPLIRLYKVPKLRANEPMADAKAAWLPCNPRNLAASGLLTAQGSERSGFSAIGFYFARELRRALGVPVGVIESSWGGTRIEPWIPPQSFDTVDSLKPWAEAAGQNPPARLDNERPSQIYFGMITPLVPFAIRGALWYQGESNLIAGNDTMIYRDKMQALVGGWRNVWNLPDLPFYYVQIAPYLYSKRNDRLPHTVETLPEFWEAQTAAMKIPGAGMALTVDLADDPRNIHPQDKLNVGRRLARMALHRAYGRRDIVDSGPFYKSSEVEGDKMVIQFTGVAGGLVAGGPVAGGPLQGFTIAGEDGRFVPAHATIDEDMVEVSSPDVLQPKAVRYLWTEFPTPTLFNKSGLPAAPFRTDGP